MLFRKKQRGIKMKCPKCGEVFDDKTICPNCNEPLTDENIETAGKEPAEEVKPQAENASETKSEGESAESAAAETEAKPEQEIKPAKKAVKPAADKKHFNVKKTASGLITVFKNLSPLKKAIACACAALAVFLIVFGIWYAAGVSSTKKTLMQDWVLVEQNNNVYIRTLVFEKDKAEFCFESRFAWLNNTIAVYEYKVVFPSRVNFKTDGFSKTVKIDFSEDKQSFTITPALSGDDESQTFKAIEKDRRYIWK